ncbi:hypothetical protein PSA7680_00229 [Pseudoruegeria aquimaris]|uniref:PIN domain-containing protein n=1 Tax=Pseudoruegeria aquimaris TaxID=393663 RepID=A0A1Y5RBR5_9RHOB|nr:PIN domain-containing protein [Pseudoruegeria aquimaris]SLN12957.1 hypothetical protein PSA7680_00229 [Pseudoruegeria aquimaris]
MKLVVDACVLYPTVLREVVSGVAQAGVFTPLYSERILGEWTHAAARLGPVGGAQAEGEAALWRARFPLGLVAADPELEARLYLPDPTDRHVLAAAITGGADGILTLNLKDFPRRELAEHGLAPLGPDAFLRGLAEAAPELLRAVTERVHAEAERLSGEKLDPRRLYKKARLPRMAKALYG